MTLTVHLLGRPRIEGPDGVRRFRSRKSWAVLAYLLLGERPPTRAQLAMLLFGEAEDPLRALRWSLSEVRRALAGHVDVEGDPVVLALGPDAVLDAAVVSRGAWVDAVRVPGLGSELLEGAPIQASAAFESWLVSERRRVAAASEAILHEAAMGSLSLGRLDDAIGFAARAVGMSPLDENHHALLIRLYRISGDDRSAERALAACADLLDRELGVAPGAVVRAAMREGRTRIEAPADPAWIEATIESGAAAVSAGATETGADTLRTAVRMADAAGHSRLRVSSRLVLAEALVHTLGGLDEEGMAALLAANDIALADGDLAAVAAARSELGYVDFLRARYDRAEVWLSQALEIAEESSATAAKATRYLGSVESDRASYGRASRLLERGAVMSREVGDVRGEAYARSMLGRVHLLRGELDEAETELDRAIRLGERAHWLAFLPWPQTLRGEVLLARGRLDAASTQLGQAFARACQVGDPCWEGMAARGLALLAAAEGDTERAFALLADARVRSNRLADPYVWLEGYILDAQCSLGLRHGHQDTPDWVESMRELTSRTGMRELLVRAMWHGAALGLPGDADAASLLVADIDNPNLIDRRTDTAVRR